MNIDSGSPEMEIWMGDIWIDLSWEAPHLEVQVTTHVSQKL